jgi:hypothetical protein
MSTSKDAREGWVTVGIEWDPEGLATVRQATALLGVSLDHLVRTAAVQEAARVIRSRKGMLDLAAAAEVLGVTRQEVVKLVGDGKLRARKIDGEWMVDEQSVREHIHQEPVGSEDMIELDLRELVEANSLSGLDADGEAPDEAALSWCYVSQRGVLVCPRAAWRRLGREKVVTEARDAVRRFVKRRDEESGRR